MNISNQQVISDNEKKINEATINPNDRLTNRQSV